MPGSRSTILGMLWLIGMPYCNSAPCPATGDWRGEVIVGVAFALLMVVALIVVWRALRQAAPPAHPSAKPQISDQAPGEEVVQVNDAYAGGGPPPSRDDSDRQHLTGG